MTPPGLPRLVRWLVRLSPVPPDARGVVQADLHELFIARRAARGAGHAQRRLYHDVASLWLTPRRVRRSAASGSALALLRDVRADLRYGARLFARQPGILLLTIVGLALGLGVATAAFSIMNAAVLRGEGLAEPGRAPGILRTTDRSVSTAWGYAEFQRLREGATRMQVEAVLTDGALVWPTPHGATAVEADPPSAPVAFVSGGFFAAAGGRTARGRPLEPADEAHAGPPPAVVSFVFWTTKLNQDPAVIGRTIRIGRTEATVVGVAERGFSVPNNRMLWMPLSAYGAVYDPTPVKRTPDLGLEVFGRLLPGATLAEAEAQLNAVAATLPRSTTGDSAPGARLDRRAGLGRVAASEALAVTLFVFGVIGLVLLLACANVATVLIATAISRDRELGVRRALGATGRRIARQLVTESIALGGLAAAVGLLFAHWAVPMIGTMVDAPAGSDLAPDLTVYVFLGVVTLVTGVGAGLAPAWHGRGVDLLTPLKGEARQNRMAPRRLRSMLVMTQAAVSVLLLVVATLFVRASFRAARVDIGFDATGLYAVSGGFGAAGAQAGTAARDFWTRAIAELRSVPGVAVVTLAELTPFDGLTQASVTRDTPSRTVAFNGTGARYFEAVGLRTLAGRTYTGDEVAALAPVVVVSQTLARVYWRDQSPLGEMLPPPIPIPQVGGSARPVVIGVVADAVTQRLHQRNTFAVYMPLAPSSEALAQLLVRVEPGSTGVIDHARQRLRALDAEADIRVTSVADRLQQETSQPLTLATLTGIVGILAVVLCVIGLYGLTASVVSQRTREMAVRVAMGAEPWDLLRLLMWDSLRPVVLGLVIGAGAALLASRLLAGILFGVSPQDPMAFTGAAVSLLAAATLAVLVPTRRAAAVDPAFVLRQG